MKRNECNIMLVEDPVLRVGLRSIFQSWNFVFSNANFFHMPAERKEKKKYKKKQIRICRNKKNTNYHV